MDALNHFLDLYFPAEKFSDKQRAFLQRYSIEKASSVNSVLTEIGEKTTKETAYYTNNPHVKVAVQHLQSLYQRYKKPSRVSGFGSFAAFLEWWCSQCDEDGTWRCYYCGVPEKLTQDAFQKKVISSQKPSFSGRLQIDRKDPKGGYNSNNCVLACVLCNNAKSDMISANVFKIRFGSVIRSYWEDINK